jgi:hypothetical protein
VRRVKTQHKHLVARFQSRAHTASLHIHEKEKDPRRDEQQDETCQHNQENIQKR